MVRYFFITISFFILIWGVDGFAERKSSIDDQIEQQVADIDDQIQELEAMKRGYISKALRHEDQAERMQFEDRTWLEARRHWQLAEENREMAAKIQVEIDRLKVRRLEILRRNGDNMLPPKGGDGFEDI